MNNVIFFIIISAELITTIALVVSMLSPQNRIWPPNRQNSWGQYFMLILFNVTAIGIVVLGIVEWDSYVIPLSMRMVGSIIWMAGNVFAIWAVITLGLVSTSGNEGKLVRKGPYRMSRNPQYVGFITGLVGWGVMANSSLLLIAVLVAVIPLVIVPLAEEPWMQMKYGEEYEDYMLTVPRFLSWR
jgi:protein-S-isoprenylcysteine O-methyltransferase Ste14